MLCPQCGARNELGSQHCIHCRYPFTRSAAQAMTYAAQPRARRQNRPQPATAYAGPPTPAGNQAQQPPRVAEPTRRTRRRRMPRILLILLLGLSALLLLLLVGALVREQLVKPFVADQVRSELDSGIQSAVQQSVTEQATLPVDEPIVLTETDLNENLAGYDLGPVDDLTIDLRPDGVDVNLAAYGLSGRYSAGLAVENGRLVLEDGSFSGPLSLVVPTSEVEQIASDALAAALHDAGYNIAALELGDGTLALTLAR